MLAVLLWFLFILLKPRVPLLFQKLAWSLFPVSFSIASFRLTPWSLFSSSPAFSAVGRVGSRLTFLEGLEQPEYCTVGKLPESSVAWRCPLPTPSPTPVSPSGAGFALSIPFHIIAAGILSPQFPMG